MAVENDLGGVARIRGRGTQKWARQYWSRSAVVFIPTPGYIVQLCNVSERCGRDKRNRRRSTSPYKQQPLHLVSAADNRRRIKRP